MQEYEIYESRINQKNWNLPSDRYKAAKILSDKILNIAIISNNDITATFERIACILMREDEKIDERGFNLKGMFFSSSEGMWMARRNVNGKRNFIKSSVNPVIVKKALIEFCNKHGLEY